MLSRTRASKPPSPNVQLSPHTLHDVMMVLVVVAAVFAAVAVAVAAGVVEARPAALALMCHSRATTID